jgi:hypothetical protein
MQAVADIPEPEGDLIKVVAWLQRDFIAVGDEISMAFDLDARLSAGSSKRSKVFNCDSLHGRADPSFVATSVELWSFMY